MAANGGLPAPVGGQEPMGGNSLVLMVAYRTEWHDKKTTKIERREKMDGDPIR
jgi:hypothetical protein